MTAKEFLSTYLKYESRIEGKKEKILELKQMATSISYTFKQRVQTSKQVNGTEKIITQYMDMQKELVSEVEKLHKQLYLISKVISKLQDNDEKEVLERKYINGQTFSAISGKMCICERQIFRIHGKALEKVQAILEKI